MASTADISDGINPRLLAKSGENLHKQNVKIFNIRLIYLLANSLVSNSSGFKQSRCVAYRGTFW